jgi:hypothetical protein
MQPMNSQTGLSDNKIRLLSVGFYLALWLAELTAKIVAVRLQFSGDVVQSSLTAKIGEALRLFGLDALRYGLTLILVYALFGWLNGHYAGLAAQWLRHRHPGLGRSTAGVAFFGVNGTFVIAVYALNAAFYPGSDLAILRALAGSSTKALLLRLASGALLGLFLLGFVLLNMRYSRKGMKAAILVAWAVILLAPLDPGYLVHRTFSAHGGSRNKGPNVILIGLDSLNPQHTGYFGYSLPLTPHLDSFLKENIVFTNCYTPIARTFPAWYTILTGQYPTTSGVRFNLIKRKEIKSARQSLGFILKEKGYATVHFTDEVRFSNITPGEGFDVLRHPPMGVEDFLFGSLHDFSLTNVFFNNPLGYALFPFSDINRAVAQTYDGRYFINDLVSAIDRLKRKERFFLAVHLCLAHWPYIHASPRDFSRGPGADPRMALYDAAVSKVDDQFRRIIAALKADGLYENSIVAVLSDHGESAEGHGSELRDLAQNHILLAWKPAGSSIHRDVGILSRTIDIAPTILDLLGEDDRRFPFDGMSLKPWLGVPEAANAEGPESVIMETEFSLETPGGVGQSLQSLIAQGSKFYEFDRDGLITVRDDYHDILIRRRNRAILTPDWLLTYDTLVRKGRESWKTSLFDIRRDPGCRSDVSAAHPNVAEDLARRLREHYGAEVTAR